MTKTVFAYYNEKGGVGKTSSVLSMLYFFNSMKLFKRAVAIDMDPQRSLTLLSGCQSKYTVLDVLADEVDINDAIVSTPYGDIIPTNRELKTVDAQMDVNAAETDSQRKEYEGNLLTLRKKLKGLKNYDYVILDCPPGYANIAMSCLVAADILIIPAKASKASLYALSSISPIIEVARRYNKGLKIAGVLLTYHNDRTNAARYGAEASIALAEANLNTKVFKNVIRYSTAVEDAYFEGVPLLRRNTPVAEDYRRFFEEMLKGEGLWQ